MAASTLINPTFLDGKSKLLMWQLEEQAVGRCWRMGQERPVVIKRYGKVSTISFPCAS
jgi:hypothetical protein